MALLGIDGDVREREWVGFGFGVEEPFQLKHKPLLRLLEREVFQLGNWHRNAAAFAFDRATDGPQTVGVDCGDVGDCESCHKLFGKGHTPTPNIEAVIETVAADVLVITMFPDDQVTVNGVVFPALPTFVASTVAAKPSP